MIKLLKNLWGRLLFRDKGILPTKKLLAFFLIISSGLLLLSIWEVSWVVLILINLFFLLLSLIDLAFIPATKQIIVERRIPDEMERGISYPISINITNHSKHQVKFRVIDGIPQSFQKDFPIMGFVQGESSTTASYKAIAKVRGMYAVKEIYIRYRSLLGLWERQAKTHQEHTVKVIPDLTSTRNYLESAQKFLLHEGMKVRKHKTGSGEFTKIRSFVVGDDPRKINWRQTAKLQEVMTNEYEPEHGKYITVLIDCGRMMGVELSKSNRLEKALEAALTLIAAALQKGDYVSVLAFSKNVKVYVPPAKGMAHLQTILEAVYNLEVDASESNYAAVLTYLQTVQKKRSLLLLFSDVQTFLHEESALVYLKRLRKRHLFLMLGIEDEFLLNEVRAVPSDVQKAMKKSVAQQQQLFKKREKIKWEKQGLQMVEAKEENLATVAVSNYISMMNQGIL
ncbi:DUF58 domain-containing protein [Metabacillus litoralis]|uniref:DUF58 domain-containing protein n=1 Tax=Metabacillus litoralis TaxID=152268 RepID=A0A5C6VYA9_9BACI|nr:DUF58 domain-containing protein [Metabacillus litoralis]TXC90302.1 DUF58 domain-containing protein [Metabacillus litoralis]